MTWKDYVKNIWKGSKNARHYFFQAIFVNQNIIIRKYLFEWLLKRIGQIVYKNAPIIVI